MIEITETNENLLNAPECNLSAENNLDTPVTQEVIHAPSDSETRLMATEVIEELLEASRLYYTEGETPSLTDEEFDAKQDFLETLSENPNYAELFTTGTDGHKILEGDVLLGASITTNEEPVTHIHPMLSLAKAKKPEELTSYIAKARKAGVTDFNLQAKLDGLAISAHYENRKLTLVATRGDGETGENVSYLIDTPNLTIKGMPKTIDNDDEIEVRGEIFFTNEQFEQANNRRIKLEGISFENPRNAVSGLIKKSKSGLKYKVTMTFSAYSTLDNGIQSGLEPILNNPNFINVQQLTKDEAPNVKLSGFKDNAEIEKAIEDFGKVRETFSVPTDGVVIKPVNEAEMYAEMGLTSHHPVSQIAWKYPSKQAQATITEIFVTVGKTGKLTPVANITPTKLDGSTISRASLHNFNLVHTKNIRVGSTVIIEKANEIIPQIVTVIKSPQDSTPLETPTNCPSCDSKLAFEGTEYPPRTLTCENSTCPSKDFHVLKAAVGRTVLDIDGLSEAILTYLNDTDKVRNVSDLYTLTKEDLTNAELAETSKGNKRKLGEKRAIHILGHIEKSKTLPLERVLPSLAIPTIGRRASKVLVKAFKTIEGIKNATLDEISNIEGFGEIKSENIYNGIRQRESVINKMIENGVTFGNTTDVDTEEENDATDENSIDLTGKSFSISGSVPEPFENRNALVDYIEENGGSFHSTPKAGTTYMIGENSGTSIKVKKATHFGSTFISPEEFTKQFTS